MHLNSIISSIKKFYHLKTGTLKMIIDSSDSGIFKQFSYLTLLVAFAIVIYTYFGKIRKQKTHHNWPRDTVILHQFPRGLRAPSVSPFALKLETW